MLRADSSARVQSERAEEGDADSPRSGDRRTHRNDLRRDRRSRRCGRWLARSDGFEGITDISPAPLAWTNLVRARPKTAPFPFGVQKTNDGPRRAVVTRKNRWAERE